MALKKVNTQHSSLGCHNESTYFGGAKDIQEYREKLAEYGEDLVFGKVGFDELGENLHSAMY